MNRLFFIFFLLTIIPFSSWAQKIPTKLETPATPQLEKQYSKVVRNINQSRISTIAGCCVTTLGGTFLLTTVHGNEHGNRCHDEPGMDEGRGMAVVFEALLTEFGLCLTAGGLLGETIEQTRLKNICEHNEFLLQAGNTEQMWRYNRAVQTFENSGKAMKITGISTCCLAGCSVAGIIACMAMGDNCPDFISGSSEISMFLGLASGVTFLASWAVKSSAEKTIRNLGVEGFQPTASISPFVKPSSLPGSSPSLGLTLTARF